tara:strand:- start:170 stop:532 length:363 start_codon:yes stop_codon:yes gene_type:complete
MNIVLNCPARPYLKKILGSAVEETRLSTVGNGFQELTDAQKCIASNGYCWWYVGDRMQNFGNFFNSNPKRRFFDFRWIFSNIRITLWALGIRFLMRISPITALVGTIGIFKKGLLQNSSK